MSLRDFPLVSCIYVESPIISSTPDRSKALLSIAASLDHRYRWKFRPVAHAIRYHISKKAGSRQEFSLTFWAAVELTLFTCHSLTPRYILERRNIFLISILLQAAHLYIAFVKADRVPSIIQHDQLRKSASLSLAL